MIENMLQHAFAFCLYFRLRNPRQPYTSSLLRPGDRDFKLFTKFIHLFFGVKEKVLVKVVTRMGMIENQPKWRMLNDTQAEAEVDTEDAFFVCLGRPVLEAAQLNRFTL